MDTNDYRVLITSTNKNKLTSSNMMHRMQFNKLNYLQVYDWDYALELGEADLKPVTPPSPSSIYIICHTSGTTGQTFFRLLKYKLRNLFYFFYELINDIELINEIIIRINKQH